jgi:hypothetical protein
MKLKEIATISGKPGLFRILKATKTGVIVESMDDKRIKTSIGTSHRVSILKEVSIYTRNQDGSTALEEVLHRIHGKYAAQIPIDGKASNDELKAFLEEFVPDYDTEKVYPSDMKKLITWYGILTKYSPETFDTLLKEEEEKPAEVSTEEVKAEETTAKTEETKTEKKAKKAKTEEKTAEVTEKTPTKPKAKTETTEETPIEKEEKPKTTKKKTKTE